MGAVLDEVVGPDVVRPLRAEPDAGAVIEPETAPLCLSRGDFQPFAPPDPLDPLVVHLPARLVEHAGDHAVPIPTVLTGQLDDVLGQALFVRLALRDLALRRSVLPECAPDPALRYAEGLAHTVDAVPPARRAQ